MFAAADGRSFAGFPINSIVKIPVHEPVVFIPGYPMPPDLIEVVMPVYVGWPLEAQRVVAWPDCDLLLGRDLLSRFEITLVNGTARFDRFRP